jgi:kynurenine 3-monooxygenase
MVPFYGQGLNCGLEDVRILDALFRQEKVESVLSPDNSSQYDQRIALALERYTENRHEDLVAICDLATEN